MRRVMGGQEEDREEIEMEGGGERGREKEVGESQGPFWEEGGAEAQRRWIQTEPRRRGGGGSPAPQSGSPTPHSGLVVAA